MIDRQLSLSRVKIHRVLQNSIKPQLTLLLLYVCTVYPNLVKRLLQRAMQLFVIVLGFLSLPHCGIYTKAAVCRRS